MTLLNSEQLNRLQSLLSTLSDNQLIWILGYIYGLITPQIFEKGTKNTNTITVSTKMNPCIKHDHTVFNKITIIYASQTGNARRIATELHSELIKIGLDVILCSAGRYKFKKIVEIKTLIFITSTHGEGEPPEEAIPLYRYLCSKKAPILKDTQFAVLSLGDRSYEHFAKAGKDFDKKFEELGAYRLRNRVDVDVDFLSEVNMWKKQLISDFISKKSAVSTLKHHDNIQNNVVISRHIEYSKEFPVIAHLSNRQKITSRYAIKDVHHLEMNITGSNISYQPGDSVGVWYENDLNLIAELLKTLHLTGYELVEVQGKSMCLYEALQKYYELTQNHVSVLRKIALISQDKSLAVLLTNQEKLNTFISEIPLIDMIRQISINLEPQDLLKILRPIKPRFYSIASAQSEVGDEIHITVSAVRYQINGYLRSGGASSYLIDRVQEHDELRIFIESNDNFRLPNNSEAPMIMIGSGTGVAPFRAFIQQRASDQSIGKNWLFFGNVRFIDDFLYQTEWQDYVKSGVLNRIDTAWSRDQEHKVYVQDKLLQNSAELWNWIQSGAYVYVCGDAKRMAHDVEQALILLVSKHGYMNLEKSNDFWNNMRIQHRYQRDVY